MSEGFDAWLETAKYAKRTKYTYSTFAKKMPEGYPIDQHFVDQFVADHNYTTARAFIKDYVHEYLRMTNIIIPKVRGKERKRRMEFLTKEEVILLAEKAKEHDERIALIIMMMFDTASRISEILELDAETDVDISQPGRYIIRGVGKGNVEFEAFLTYNTAKFLYKLVQEKKLPTTGKLFAGIYYDMVRKLMIRLGKEYLNKNIGTHDMKRACIRHLDKEGWADREIQQYGRHKKFETTLIYLGEIEKEKIEKRWKETFSPSPSSSSARQNQES